MKEIKIRFVDLPSDVKDNLGSPYKDYYKELLKSRYILNEEDEPDYVVTHVPVMDARGFEYKEYPNAVIIFEQNENVFPDFYCYDYVIGHDHVLSYGDRYLYVPCFLPVKVARESYDAAMTKHLGLSEDLAHRKFCAITVSNQYNAAPEREMFFRLLSNYKRVDSGGRAFNNVGGGSS